MNTGSQAKVVLLERGDVPEIVRTPLLTEAGFVKGNLIFTIPHGNTGLRAHMKSAESATFLQLASSIRLADGSWATGRRGPLWGCGRSAVAFTAATKRRGQLPGFRSGRGRPP
eukprot:GHVU01025154.1.p5 GENE.GHVU01025154.1~~GHVU01025154.1.p5  ORF type:complete len:113 (-),score=7.53 GHVU01025154.1:338-676(-)